MNYVQEVVDALLASGSHKATKYVARNSVVRATRRRYRRAWSKHDSIDIVLTIGRPNYLERKFAAECKRAGESFPVRKIQLKALPKRRVRA